MNYTLTKLGILSLNVTCDNDCGYHVYFNGYYEGCAIETYFHTDTEEIFSILIELCHICMKIQKERGYVYASIE